MGTTSDPNDPRLSRGVDTEPTEMAETYLVLSEEERARGFVRPLRNAYVHRTCGVVTLMAPAIAETYATNPKFYGATWCVSCKMHLPVSEFVWDQGIRYDLKTGEIIGGDEVGS